MSEFPQSSNFGPTLLLTYINDLPDDVFCNIAIYADDTSIYFICDQASNLWQQLQLASEFESNFADWSNKWLVDFNAGKNELVLFDQSYTSGAIDAKMNGPVLDEESFDMLRLSSFFTLDWGSCRVSIAKTASKKIEALIRSTKVFLSSPCWCF